MELTQRKTALHKAASKLSCIERERERERRGGRGREGEGEREKGSMTNIDPAIFSHIERCSLSPLSCYAFE